ncbi:glycosyltransferase [Chloroflexota bacterium]
MTVTSTLADGTVYSQRKDYSPFSISPLEAYAPIVGNEKMERLWSIGQRLKGLKVLELNATAQGGGVAEMLYSAIPFLNNLGIDTEWKVISGNKDYFECTKKLHNLLQGGKGSFTGEMKRIYLDQLEECVSNNVIDYSPDVVIVHDPQPMVLCHYLRKNGQSWLWRCHIDIEPAIRSSNGLLSSINEWISEYDAAIFSASRYISPPWPLPKFVIPPFIDPFSDKNREMIREEIDRVLVKYQIDPEIPIIAQIGRYDPWKGLDRTVATYREVRKERNCQLVLAGGMASDDPEGERILNALRSKINGDKDVHILNLPLADRLDNYLEVNALQRAASVIMQPSTREGFGLVVTEALWKEKPVIAGNTGGIKFQIKDGDTGYFYHNPRKSARRVIQLLDNPEEAEAIGRRGRKYVQEHFIIADRLADHLLAIDMVMNSALGKKKHSGCVTSFYPW